MSIAASSLFKPLRLGTLSLPNRIVMAPMTRQASPGGVPGDNVAAYYARRAQGGVGLIVSEGTVVVHPGANRYPDVPDFFGDEALTGWRKVVEAVHAQQFTLHRATTYIWLPQNNGKRRRNPRAFP